MATKRRRKPTAAQPSAPSSPPTPTMGRELRELGGAWIAAILLVALVVRLLVNADLSRTILYSSPQLDHLEFLRWARSIAAGAPIWMPSHAPGYPFFLGYLLRLFDGSVAAARTVQAALGAATCLLVALLGSRWFGRRSGIAAGLLVAVYGPLVFIESGLLAEGPFVLLAMLALYWITLPRQPLWAAGIAGLAVGLATVFRATGILLLPAMLLIVLTDRRRRRLASAVVVAATCLLLVLPVARSFGEKFDSGLFLQGFGGLNFLMGNDPSGSGVPSARLGGGWDLLSGEAFHAGAITAGQRERYYYRKALRRIGEDPLGFGRMLLVKSFWLLQNEEPRETHSICFFRASSPILRLLPGFWLVLPLAATGVWLAWRQRRLPAAPLWFLLFLSASCVLFVVSLRYRLPLVPVLAVFAGLSLIWCFDAARAKRWRSVARWSAAVLAILALTLAWTHPPSRDVAEELALSASSLERDGRLEEAAATYREALELDADSAYALAGLGRTLLRQGDLEAAASAFARAITANPAFSGGHGGMGSVRWMQGRPQEAIQSYREALRLAPDSGRIARDLGTLLVQQGELTEALAVFEQILLFNPNEIRALLAVARIQGALERPREGMAAAARAAELDPADLEAWVLYAMLASYAGDLPAAERALERAGAMGGATDPRVRFGWVILLQQRGERDRAEQLLASLLADFPDFDPARALAWDRAGAPPE